MLQATDGLRERSTSWAPCSKTSAGSALMVERGIADFPAARHQKKAKFRPSMLPNN
jgi:hypothetical protein